MPLLYESVVQTKKVRAKSVSRQLQEEAPFWRVVEVYKVGSIYMTPEQLKSEIQKAVNQAATEKGLKVLSWRVLDMWAEWKGVYTEYFCRYEAYFGEASSMAKTRALVIPYPLIIVCLTIIVSLLIILFIVLVSREAVEAVFKWVPEEAKPWLATLLLVGLGLLVVGGGVYLIKSVIPKIKRK
jgi:uncharacterized BrkB/YihY/UPF0761 family membrane protein